MNRAFSLVAFRTHLEKWGRKDDKTMPRKADIGDMEKRMLDATLPYGISCFRFMRIGDENNINDDRRAYERNQKKGFIDYTKRDYKGKETKRFQITPTGISKTLEKIIPTLSHIGYEVERRAYERTVSSVPFTEARLSTWGIEKTYGELISDCGKALQNSSLTASIYDLIAVLARFYEYGAFDVYFDSSDGHYRLRI